jgi:hypothetical protein
MNFTFTLFLETLFLRDLSKYSSLFPEYKTNTLLLGGIINVQGAPPSYLVPMFSL